MIDKIECFAQVNEAGESLVKYCATTHLTKPVHSEVDIPFLKPNCKSLVRKNSENWERMTHSKILLRDGASAIERQLITNRGIFMTLRYGNYKAVPK